MPPPNPYKLPQGLQIRLAQAYQELSEAMEASGDTQRGEYYAHRASQWFNLAEGKNKDGSEYTIRTETNTYKGP